MPSSDQGQLRGAGRPANYQGDTPRGKSCFLGIAIDAYDHFTPLRNAVRDMEAVYNLLLAEYDLEAPNCRLLRNEQASRKNILRTLADLDEWVGEDDKLIIYYSGHGHLNRKKRGFWVPVEAERGAEEDYVSNARLRELLADIPAKHILVISDSCFSGTLFVRAAQRADVVSSDLELRPSRWALCSGRHDQVVADGEPGAHSPFAASILQELRYNKQAALRIGSLADRVIEVTRANYEQLPEGSPLQGVGHQGGQYVFRRQENEAALWAQIQALPDDELSAISTKRRQLREFLRKHPQSIQAEEAIQAGIALDNKREFLQCYDSEFGLLAFVRKDTPYRELAQQRLRELEELDADEIMPPSAPPPKRVPPASVKPAAKVKSSPSPSFGSNANLDDPILRQMADNMVLVEGGSFTMGWQNGRDGEKLELATPAHQVRVADFYLSKYPVTQAEWQAVIGNNPADHNDCDHCPVTQVSWNDIQQFLKKLNALTGLAYRLPSEAEWEYAARGGNQSRGYLYSGSKELDEVGWYSGNTKSTQPVGQKKANELGLYDLSGNVWEWCADDWHGNYKHAPGDGRAWIDSPRDEQRVLRGGSWGSIPRNCRSADRNYWWPDFRVRYFGFRLAAPVQGA